LASGVVLSLIFNSIQFILNNPISQITNVPQRALQSVHIDIPDLTSEQEKLQKHRKNPFTGKKGRNLQQSNRGGSLSRRDRRTCVM